MPLLLEFVPFVTLLGIIFLATSYLYRTTGREEHVARPTRMPIPSPARSSVHNPILSSVYNPIRSPSQRSVNSSVYEGDSMDQTLRFIPGYRLLTSHSMRILRAILS
ncbi:hypothetical protein F4819DRAFT_463996 [Hypoxylon fuscum]|nr:hypothetical protein F4819DRAFT_463996 [Hypoxylon fuscum]